MRTPRHPATRPAAPGPSTPAAGLVCLLLFTATATGAPPETPQRASSGAAVADRDASASASESVLKPGSNGPAVEGLQRRLNARLDPSPGLDVDGDYGDATRAAVARFQRAQGLEPTGVADARTRRALGSDPIETPQVPAPEVVNAQVPRRGPPDPLDGPPFVTAKAWAIADGRSGATLWGRREAEPLPMASTTKIMTALVVLRLAGREPGVLDEVVTFSERADGTPGSTSGIRAGEQLPVRELLYGLLLPSGNDAAVALAEHFGGRLSPPADAPDEADPLPRFNAEMNRVAAELDLRETRFANPNGLPASGHHASARDLASLARHALARPDFSRVVSTTQRGARLVDGKGGERNVVWKNTNTLLETEGYDGVKTGTTNAAGACLVASGRRGDDRLIVVILGSGSSEGRYTDARNLFRWAWLRRGHGVSGPDESPSASPPETKPTDRLVLFDGKGLDGWKKADFAHAGAVKVEDGALVMGAGNSMTGITSTRQDLPTTNYELAYEAERLGGRDFFAAATFPVGKSHITLVNGGWGGNVTGLSSIDGSDASENETSTYVKYQDKTWYAFRVRVTDRAIRCWVDDKKAIDVNIEGRQVDTRIETEANKPLGFATWHTSGALRKVEVRRLTPAEVAEGNKSDR